MPIGQREEAVFREPNCVRQTNEDFIDELLQIREHQRALDVIHTLSDGIRDASEKLKKLLGAIKTPGA